MFPRKFGKARDASKYGKRHKPGVMNQTETAYAAVLEELKENGSVIDWQFESMTFKLADGCRYTPDFFVTYSNLSMECIDCKGAGPMDDKSRVKIKCAAEKFWQFRFVIQKRRTKKDGGGFVKEVF